MNITFLSFGPQHDPIREVVMSALGRVYDSYWYVMGQTVRDFETAYANFSGAAHCVGVANGLDALYLALLALGIGPGDEVIGPSNTYIATWLAVSYVGATLVPVEPDPATYNLDPRRLEAAITPRTRAIMPVHLHGQACEMTVIMDIAQRRSSFVIEDNVQAQGARADEELTGSFGHANGTSFYPGKNLGALGDAGAVTTNDEALAQKIQTLHNYGSQQKYYNDILGYNSRLDESQAAAMSVKLKYLPEWTRQRQQVARWYDEQLGGIDDLQLPGTAHGSTHVFHLYVVRTSRRDALQQHLTASGVGTLIHYPVPPHLQQAYAHMGIAKGTYPIAEELADTSLSLPMWPGMTEEHVATVAASIRSVL
jgi:dTDP-4-amino-4,6-dideoxygalactose transaminase